MQYNLSELVQVEEKATRAVKDMEERKAKLKATLEQLEQKNEQFIACLETLTADH